MINRSSVYFRGGLVLIVVGTVFSMPSVLAVMDIVPELGDAWRSPVGAALGVIAVVGGAVLVGCAFRIRRAERRGRGADREG